MMGDSAEEGLSPGRYRLLLTLPGLGFLTGSLLFWLSAGSSGAIVLVPLAIVIAVGSWIAMVWVYYRERCPGCGKSPFVRLFRPFSSTLPESLRAWGAPWPERNCSRCGVEVGATPD